MPSAFVLVHKKSGYVNLDRRLVEQLERARVWFAVTIALGAIGGALIIAQASELSKIVASVFLHGARIGDLWPRLLLLIGIMSARAVIVWAGEVSAFRIAARVKTDLHARLVDQLLRLGPAYVRGERTGDLLTAATDGIEALEAYYSQYLPQLVLAALVPLSILLFVAPIDLLSAVVLLVTGPLVPLFMILIGRAADALTRRQYSALSRMSAHFLDVLQGLTTLKILRASREQSSAIARVSERFRDATMDVLRVAFLSAFALETIATISTAVVAVEVGLRLLYGQMQFEPAFFILILAPEYYLPLRLLGTRFHAAMSGAAAGNRLFEILSTEGKSPDPLQPALSTAPGGRSPRVELRDVRYSYDGGRTALDGVSLVLEPGERAALVGPTGAGKSTLVSLLLRFISPDAGSIQVDNVPLGCVAASAWRQNVAWVPQDPYLFDASIADNIRLARPDACTTDLVKAATMADADDFIRSLPQSYETLIGERGARLSAGQAQRIAIARAFLKDAPFVILDEATSNLDVASQAQIQDAIEQLLQGRTCLIVTHRLDTIQRADQIVVLSQGRVAESGRHASLIDTHGPYYRLVSAAFVDGIASVDRSSGRKSPAILPLRNRPSADDAPAKGA
ncbi:MAG: thiol reductant ABC exporter subunit CydD, partial [Chloroflexi bacterium]|nr:thiol reductant ABC exporter subunit CydD [Chloroflexota bacterium]